MVLALLALFAAVLWVVVVSSPLISFALTAAIAVAWCVQLEKHPDSVTH